MIEISHLGPYEVQSLLATGGMGEVYLARDTRLKRRVALKVLHPSPDAPLHHQRFLQEARAASALNHPNIVTVYDVGEENGIDYIAMEYIDGASLASVLAGGPLDVDTSLNYAAQATDALARAHEAGIVHRDVKPANLMIACDGRVKVLDFGIAKLVDDARRTSIEAATTRTRLTVAGALVGTYAYMSPEQGEGRQVDARSDIFSFGVVLYEALTGVTPFLRDSSIGTLSAILKDVPPPVEQLRPGLPPELRAIVNRCLCKDPADRFQTMANLHVAIVETARHRAGRDTASAPRVSRRSVAVASVLVVLGIVVTPWVSRLWRQQAGAVGVSGATVSRLTFDRGLQTQPVWSPDGRKVAYSADRDGNFDIFVQAIDGGKAVRLTSSPDIDWQPDWSPDGSRIVFRSEREEGGLFIVPAPGGTEQRISSFGHRPRWSPDGQHVMFVSSAMAVSEVPGIYIVAASGHELPRQILADQVRDFRSVTSVQWHPTRDVVTFVGRKGEHGWDLWATTLQGAPPRRFAIPDGVKKEIVTVASAVWAPDGRSVYLEGTSQSGITNVYQLTASIDRVDASTPQMLTSGLQDSEIAISRDGRRLAYTRRQERNRIWLMPLSGNSADTATARALTDEDMHALLSDVTSDGSRMAFIAFRDGQPRQELWEASVAGAESHAWLVDDFRRVALRWSRDGRLLAYRRSIYDATRTHAQHTMVILESGNREEQQVTSRAEDGFDIPFDWSQDGKFILGGTSRLTSRSLIARYPLVAAPHAETKLEIVAQAADANLWQARYSHGDALIAFTRVPRSGGESVVEIVRAAGGPWTTITEAGRWADKPRWAAEGSELYYISNRVSGSFNVWAQLIDPGSGRPVGEPLRVTQFEGPRLMINPLLASVELSVVRGAIILPLLELSGNIWLITRPDE